MGELTFLGYRRGRGRPGVRNHFLVLSINGLITGAARRVADAIDGAHLVATPYGRGQFGPDRDLHFRQLVGIASNPNVAAVLIIGADRKTADRLASAIGERSAQSVEIATLDDVGEDTLELTAMAVRAGARLARTASAARREKFEAGELLIGLECGHSDATSGLAAPLVGSVADRLIESGGAAMVGETLEWLGAESALTARAVDAKLGQAVGAAVTARETAVSNVKVSKALECGANW